MILRGHFESLVEREGARSRHLETDVGGGRIELPTRRFSIFCSTD